MAILNGYSTGVQFVSAPGVGAVQGGAQPAARTDPGNNTLVIDGTPVRVVVLALAAAAGLTALRLGGFRFNVGVSS